MTLAGKRANLITVLVILATFFIGYRLLYIPAQERKRMLQKGLEMAHKRNEILRDIARFRKNVKELETRIATPRDESWLLTEVANIANQAKVKLVSIEPQPRAEILGYVKLSVKIEAQCDFHALGDFVNGLESSPYFLKVDSLEIATAYTEAEGPGYRAPEGGFPEGAVEPPAVPAAVKPQITMMVSTLFLKK